MSLVVWSAAFVACSFTDLGDLVAGDRVGSDATGSDGLPIEHDATSSRSEVDASKGPGLDDGGEPGPADDSITPALYVPKEGEYLYVQNAQAYNAGVFDAAANRLGIDYMSIRSCAGKFSTTRSQVDPLPAKIARDTSMNDGVCWTFHIDIHPDGDDGGHQEDESFCARDGGLYARGHATTVQTQTWVFDFPIGRQSAIATTVCDRSSVYLLPGMKPGESRSQACWGTTTGTTGSYQSSGPYTYLGRETLPIDGVAEEAFHVHRDREVSGAMKGREVTEFYMSVKDGMPLRIHRWTQIITPISIPCIDEAEYNNYGSDWVLKSRVPKPLSSGDASVGDGGPK